MIRCHQICPLSATNTYTHEIYITNSFNLHVLIYLAIFHTNGTYFIADSVPSNMSPFCDEYIYAWNIYYQQLQSTRTYISRYISYKRDIFHSWFSAIKYVPFLRRIHIRMKYILPTASIYTYLYISLYFIQTGHIS